MFNTLRTLTVLALTPALLVSVAQAKGKGPTYGDPEKVDADYAVQGEYTGEIDTDDGKAKFGIQIIALGQGKFAGVGYSGGLPGDGWDKGEKIQAESQIEDGVVVFTCDKGTATYKDGNVTIADTDGNALGTLKKVVRTSPTLGAKPPQEAVVLFDGTSLDHWEGGARMTEDGLLMEGVVSKDRFQSHTLHVEFRLPYQPEARGQGRGNSGLYVQGRYEIQMLDSFGLEGRDNECGGVYKVSAPSENMCFPPLTWQTYDVDFTAPKFDESGKQIANARMTVKHNGVVIHDDAELPRVTPGGRGGGAVGDPGPVYLQGHGNPVRYRNIWVLPK